MAAQPRIVISSKTLRDADALEAMLARLPNLATRRMARGMAGAMSEHVKQFRASLPNKFKVKKTKAGNAFKWFVEGKSLNTLQAHFFTQWRLARLYEFGGTIRGKGSLAIPVSPKAYTAQGRVKKRWHDPKNFKNLKPIPHPKGLLLVKEKQSVKQADGTRLTARQVFGKGKRGAVAIEPMFLVVRTTSRKPTIRFYSDWDANQGRVYKRMEKAAFTLIERDTEIGGVNAG